MEKKTQIIDPNIPISQQMDLESYKAHVRESLLKIPPYTIPVVERLMKDYEKDFQYEYENNSDPQLVATQIAFNLL